MRTKDSDRSAFIPRWLDEYGLKPAPFRVYCNLARRITWKTRTCFCSVRDIAETCRLNKDTVTAAIADLEALGFVVRVSGKPGRTCNTYCLPLRVESVRKEGTTTTQDALSETEGHDCPKPRDGAVRKGGAPKVSPMKVSPFKVSPLTPPPGGDAPTLPENASELLEEEHPDLSPGAIAIAVDRTEAQIANGKAIAHPMAFAAGLAKRVSDQGCGDGGDSTDAW